MTDRYAGFLVTLEEDVREDDAVPVINALRMTRGVLTVTPVTTDTIDQQIATHRVNAEWHDRIHALLTDTR